MFNLQQGDCLELLKNIPDNSVDLIVTDPPYKVTNRGGYTSAGGMLLEDKVRKGEIFDNNSTGIADYLKHLYRVLKESGHCYLMTNNKNITEFLKEVDKSDFHFVKNLIWVKDNKIMSQMYMSQFEYVLFLRKGSAVKINNCGTSDVLQFKNKKTKDSDGKNIHDTEKPVDLMSVLIENSSKIGGTVLDPFMGSGSTGVACAQTGRNFIGMEIDQKYFDIAVQRIEGGN